MSHEFLEGLIDDQYFSMDVDSMILLIQDKAFLINPKVPQDP